MMRENLFSQNPQSSHLFGLLNENSVSEQNLENLGFEHIWNVIPTSTPNIIRKCPRCERDRFCCNDKFRSNANKKIIDVWLIYKCVHCDFTFNLPIISRTTVSKIDGNLLRRLQENDKALCWQYAFDANYFQKGMKIDWDINMLIETKCLNNTESDSRSKIQIIITSDYHLKIPIFSVIRNQMQLSRSQLEKLHANGELAIYSLEGTLLNLKNHILKGCVLKTASDLHCT